MQSSPCIRYQHRETMSWKESFMAIYGNHISPLCVQSPINTNAFEDHLTEPGTCDASYREFWSKYVQTTSIFFNVFQMISTRTIWLLLSLILLNKNSVLTNTSFVEAFHQDIYIQVNLQLTCVSQVLFKQTYNKGTMTKRVADLELPSKTNWLKKTGGFRRWYFPFGMKSF